MKKTWMISIVLSASLSSSAVLSAENNVDSGILTTTTLNNKKTPLGPPVANSTTTGVPKNPFSGVSAAPAYQPRADVQITLLEGELLSQQLTQWATEKGYKLLWNSSVDFLVYQSIHLHGSSVQDVLTQLGRVFMSENYGLVIKDYRANNVLLIDEQ